MTLFKLSGYISIILGITCCVLLVNPFFLFFSLLSAILGFVASTINIYHNAKYEYSKFSIGYIGMLLCSGPVLFLLFFIFRH